MPNMSKIFCLLLVSLMLTGCFSRNVPQGGRVTYSDTGEPLEFGTVSFATSMYQFRGEIKEDGQYTIGEFRDNDGLPPDTYNITIHAVIHEGYDKNDNPIETHLIDPKYLKPETSGLTVVVDGKSKRYDIQVDRAPSKSTSSNRRK